MKRAAESVKIRKPPLYEARKGFCPWCNEKTEPKVKKDGTPRAVQAGWHRECYFSFRSAQNQALYFDAIAERDGLKCFDCGKLSAQWGPSHGTRTAPYVEYSGVALFDSGTFGGPFVLVESTIDLEVDHEIPLWKVADLPVEKRRAFFLIGNCRLRCGGPEGCHTRKSKREAAERAHYKRLGLKRKGRMKKPLPSWAL